MTDGLDELGLAPDPQSTEAPHPRRRYVVLALLVVAGIAVITFVLLVVVPWLGQALIWLSENFPFAPSP